MKVYDPKRQDGLILLCWMVYTAAYLGRYSYIANITPVLADCGVSHAEAGLVSTFFFFAYGVGQILHGVLCRFYRPRVIIPLSLGVSAVANLLMVAVPAFAAYKFLWLCNGLAQSVLWPMLMLILGEQMRGENIGRAVVVMSTTVAAGTAITYGLAALFALFDGYRVSFCVGAAVQLVMGFVWFFLYCPAPRAAVSSVRATREDAGKADAGTSAAGCTPGADACVFRTECTFGTDTNASAAGTSGGTDSDTPSPENTGGPRDPKSIDTDRYSEGVYKKRPLQPITLVLISVLALFAIVNNFIKDGLTAWVPAILGEVWGVQGALSILLTLLLPVVAMFGTALTVFLRRYVRDHVVLASLLFAVSAVLLLGVNLLLSGTVWVSLLIVFCAVSLLMAGINSIITAVAPLTLREEVNAGLLSGLLDGFCYVGSTVSSYGLGVLADGAGWTAVFRVLLYVCLVPAILGLAYVAVRRVLSSRRSA